MYTSSEINVALLGKLTDSVYGLHVYSSGTTPGILWKKINFGGDAEGCFISNFVNCECYFCCTKAIHFSSLLESISVNVK